MTTQNMTVNITGTPDADDKRVSLFMVGRENERRTIANAEIAQENARRAALDPPESALPLLTILPSATAGERKNSYEIILAENIRKANLSYLKQANEAAGEDAAFKDLRPLWADATPQKKAAAIAALS